MFLGGGGSADFTFMGARIILILTPGHLGVRVRNVCGESKPKNVCFMLLFLP